MVRTYVITGDPIYKHHYEEILAIRDGKIPRPASYQGVYWDLVLHDDKRPSTEGKAIALLDLMRQAGFTEEEFAKLEQAKKNSDELTRIEFAAMHLIESPGGDASLTREKAIQMLHDARYHAAKFAIMQPISESYHLMEQRTAKQVQQAQVLAMQLRLVFIFFGVLLVIVLWRTYRSLHYILGGALSDIHKGLVRLGSGDFYSPVEVPPGMASSVLGWLSVTQSKLAEIDTERNLTDEKNQRLTRLYNALSQCNQAIVRSTSEAELFPTICRDAVTLGGMRMAWIGLLDEASGKIKPVTQYGDGKQYLDGLEISVNPEEASGKGPSAIVFRENEPYWCQDFQNDPATSYWHERGAQFGWMASAALPLERSGRIVGIFNVYADKVNAFDESARNLLSEMAMDISHTLNRFELEKQRGHSMQMEGFRSYMLERITSNLSLKEILREVTLKLESIIPDSMCSILLIDKDGKSIRVGATPSIPSFFSEAIDGVTIGEGVGSCGTAMFTGKRTIVEDIATHPYWVNYKEIALEAGLASCWSEPIFSSSSSKVIGAFAIYQRTPSAPLSFHLKLLEMATHFIAIAIERKQSEDALRKLSQAVEQSSNAIIITDTNAKIEYVNATFLRNCGKSLEEVIGETPGIIKSGKTPASTYEDMWAHLRRGDSWQGELVNSYHDGLEHTDLVQISPVRDVSGEVTHFLGIQEDITDKKRTEERIQYLAHFDALTGLPNRTLLDERAKYAMSLARRSNDAMAVIFLDVDHFKDINDSLGHSLGDAMLIELSQRLLSSLREEDTISRLGGDEFILLLPGVESRNAEQLAQKLMQVISQSYQIGPYELNITASMGIAIYPDDGADLETLSKNADAAMYRAKREGRNTYRFFTQEMQARSARHLELVNALRHALPKDQLHVVYQPQMSIDGTRVIGAEALLRWHHPDLGTVSPAEFIPLAEENGLILPVGEWVLQTAVNQLKQWQSKGMGSLTMAVNLSAVQFRHSDLPDLVSRILEEADLPAEYLELELTESVAMHDPLGAIAVMNNLHARGIRMSIDDFGTGYSSLNYLKKFNVYKLKIDQSFVRDISTDPEDKAIVSAIIGMAKSLGLETIAEGVETAEQLEFLRAQGCAEVQGYYFSKPLPPDQFEEFFRGKNSR
ncbi:MAG: EAL domain-containing protein [Burkholderiales bacterium]|nr:EAL domain-containing protein [Burkholderiales bacterium]